MGISPASSHGIAHDDVRGAINRLRQGPPTSKSATSAAICFYNSISCAQERDFVSQPDNPPAFPQIERCDVAPARTSGYYDVRIEMSSGMSLRDYFAGQALAGMKVTIEFHADHAITLAVEGAAGYAYQLADAMLKARNSKES